MNRVEAFPLRLGHEDAYLGTPPPGAEGYFLRPPWRSLYSARFETLLVRVTCEDGTSGWGEALAPVAPEVPAAIVESLLAPALIGADPTAVRPLWHRLRDLMRERGHLVGHQADALAAVDIALWDLAGRLTGRSVAEMLGGAFRDTVPTYVSGLPRPTDAGRAELARTWAERGATRVKLHLGHGVEEDLATFDAVAATGLHVAVDAHWAYSVPEAVRLGRALADRGALFLEAPLAPEDVEGHRDLARRVDLPVAVGETLRNRYELAHWLDRRALSLAQPDVGRTGVTELMAMAELAAARHVPVAPHHSTGLGVVLAAGIHVSAALADLAFFEYQPTTCEVAGRILTAPLPGGPAGFPLPAGPGLGVEVDLDAVLQNTTRTVPQEA
ncbi:mandelate racemase/muconate lactonizing enzyme family protein [Actinomadura viridis]|uniref:Galactonate dehydratase n=1 Tax=Actinomadura viridis TaxID=58110 RepID=A0A931DSC6_9ACTN|nr:mandelate racemase/muconate lactonizing enzyme family protein [Actinomadura viridis]MBG6093864.1 galactonate dehydratase [Actinomadura viridis]